MRHRKGLKQSCPGHRKDRRVRANAQRQRADSNRRKARRLRQHTHRVAQIGAKIIPNAQTERGSHLFFLNGDSAELDSRALRGFFGRNASPDQILRVAFKMKRQLFVHLAFKARA